MTSFHLVIHGTLCLLKVILFGSLFGREKAALKGLLSSAQLLVLLGLPEGELGR